jgi:hypothetical protein
MSSASAAYFAPLGLGFGTGSTGTLARAGGEEGDDGVGLPI